MGKVDRNYLIGNAIKLELERRCTEQNIEGKDKLLLKEVDEFINTHTGVLAGFRVTEDML